MLCSELFHAYGDNKLHFLEYVLYSFIFCGYGVNKLNSSMHMVTTSCTFFDVNFYDDHVFWSNTMSINFQAYQNKRNYPFPKFWQPLQLIQEHSRIFSKTILNSQPVSNAMQPIPLLRNMQYVLFYSNVSKAKRQR